MRRAFVRAAPLVALLMIFLVGCAGQQIVKPWAEMADSEKVGHAMKAYNDAKEDYKYQFEALGPTYTQKEIDFLNGYLTTINTSWKSIALIDSYVQGGKVLTPAMNQTLLDAVRALTGKMTEGG